MNEYRCKYCESKVVKFRGLRQEVRKHLREAHGISGQVNIKGKTHSSLTRATIVVDLTDDNGGNRK